MGGEHSEVGITHHVQGQGGCYLAVVPDSSHEAYLQWEAGGMRDGKEVRIAAHTVVPRAIGGRGIAGQLVLTHLIHDDAVGRLPARA